MESQNEYYTIKELRDILYNIEDQEMTVRELRSILFGLNNQDEEIPFKLISKLHNLNRKMN